MSIPVTIEKIDSFRDDYQDINRYKTEEEIYQQIIITAKKEIEYLNKYIETLILEIVSADGKKIYVILNGEKVDLKELEDRDIIEMLKE